MALLTLSCLGAFTTTLDQHIVPAFSTDKVRALLAYLALNTRPHLRITLARLFWPDIDEAHAQKNLRNTLHRLRQALDEGDSDFSHRLLVSDHQTIALDPAHLSFDVRRFRQLISDSEAHRHSDGRPGRGHVSHCPDCLARLTQAADLYAGELLDGFSLADAPAFEEWLSVQREGLHQQATAVLFDLALTHDDCAEWPIAQSYAQRLLALDPWREEGHRLLMRIFAHSGQRSAALAQYQLCRQVLKEALDIDPEAETIALYKQIRANDLDDNTHPPNINAMPHAIKPVAALSSPPSAAPPHNLPTVLTPIVGRDHDLERILGLLQRGARLLTLIGVGGMGKTRLALEVGRQHLHAYPDGVVFVSLAAITMPSAIATTVATELASTLGISVKGGDPLPSLCQLLQPKRLLFILDNFEHLLLDSGEGIELVNTLLQASAGLQILVTTRERLNLHGEQLFQVHPLPLATHATLADATASSAVQLFLQNAQLAHAEFQLSGDNWPTILRICQLVQGMPLGLELAAAQVGVLSLNEIANAIAQNAEVLSADWHDLPGRHRSMRAVFAWSWQLLTPEEQQALRQMSIFRGGFDLSAAQAVLGATISVIGRLYYKSLLQWQESPAGERRYMLHELLRQFASEELHKANEDTRLAASHSHYYLAYLAARGLRLGRHEPKEASAEIQTELDNIRLAWQWAARQGQTDELDQAIYAWWQFTIFQGLEAEARSSFANAIVGVRQHLATLAEGDPNHVLGQRLLAKLLAIHANFLFAQGRDEEMAAQSREAIQLGAASHGVEGETFGSFVLGRALQEFRQPREAREAWLRTIELVSTYQIIHPQSEMLHDAHWMAYNWLRGIMLHFNDYTSSQHYIVRALQICQTLGKQRGELFCLVGLAELSFLHFDFASAEGNFAAALELAQALGYVRVEVLAQLGLGRILHLRGSYQSASARLALAFSKSTMLGFSYERAAILAALVRNNSQIGNHEDATRYYEELTQFMGQVTLPKECQYNWHLAAAIRAHVTHNHSAALYHAEAAQQIFSQGDILFRLIDANLILGHTRAAIGQWDAVVSAFQKALAAFEQLGNRASATEAHAGLADIALAQGNLTAARTHVEAILPVLAERAYPGYNDPFFIYLVCYRVLAALDDARAIPLLERGHSLLQKSAEAFENSARQHFLESVPTHQAIVLAYQSFLDHRETREQ